MLILLRTLSSAILALESLALRDRVVPATRRNVPRSIVTWWSTTSRASGVAPWASSGGSGEDRSL